ncbi:hypothetical protein WKI68_02110 [Streptomyces sp. MS1.HAVA.3]|uniref:Uncharacterized protein n=1 Tax=Streptomyces caledonius TaxID=3134107 RepID=A0ABU8TYP9_9ACTN
MFAAPVRLEEPLAVRLEGEREAWSRLRITRETLAEVIGRMPGQGPVEDGSPVAEGSRGLEVRVVGAIMVPHWRDGP